MSGTVTSFIPGIVAGAQPTRKADQLFLPYRAAPQAMTVYLRMRELGSVRSPIAISSRLWQIGAAAGTASIFQLAYAGGTGYQLALVTPSGTFTVTAGAKPGIGQLVELRATLSAVGTLQLGQSINGGNESLTATATALLPQTWSDTKLWIGGLNGANGGAVAIQNLLIVRGVQTLQTMRKYAGVA